MLVTPARHFGEPQARRAATLAQIAQVGWWPELCVLTPDALMLIVTSFLATTNAAYTAPPSVAVLPCGPNSFRVRVAASSLPPDAAATYKHLKQVLLSEGLSELPGAFTGCEFDGDSSAPPRPEKGSHSSLPPTDDSPSPWSSLLRSRKRRADV